MRKFAVIGYPLSHTFSPAYFSKKFEEENIANCKFGAIEIKDIEELKSILKNNPDLEGLSVTIPHKKNVVALLDWANEIVEKTGSCNCIKIVNNKLYGFNTDVIGFEKSITKFLKPYHKNALILGTGGAASAVSYVLEKLNIQFSFVSRDETTIQNVISYKNLSEKILLDNLLIINTTPIGMFPEMDKVPDIPYNKLTPRHFLFDLIYNPEKTLFLKRGEDVGTFIKNGFEMLTLQAEASWEIWNATV